MLWRRASSALAGRRGALRNVGNSLDCRAIYTRRRTCFCTVGPRKSSPLNFFLRIRVTDESTQTSAAAWRDRLTALKNVPPVLRIVWDSGPWVVVLGLVFRILVSVVPLAALVVSKKIIDHIQQITKGQTQFHGTSDYLWKLVVLEFVLVVIAGI